MKTYSYSEEGTSLVLSFYVDNVYVSINSMVGVLSGVDGVTDICRRRLFSGWLDGFEGVHVKFSYCGAECVIFEPYGDSSMYWIQQSDGDPLVDLSPIEEAFWNYHPGLVRRVVGGLLSFPWLGEW